jgi:hypothetical protein
MHVVDADIGGQPAQKCGKVVIGAAVQRGVVKVPLAVLLPHRVLELVLHVEQPHACRCGQQHDRQIQIIDFFRAGRENDCSVFIFFAPALNSSNRSVENWDRASFDLPKP